MNEMSGPQRAFYVTLLTHAGLVWLINGLHSHPLNDSTGKSLIKCVLPFECSDDEARGIPTSFFNSNDEDLGVPITPAGLIILHHITIPPEASTVRFLEINCQLPSHVFKKTFEKPLEEVQHKLNPSGFELGTPFPSHNIPRKKL